MQEKTLQAARGTRITLLPAFTASCLSFLSYIFLPFLRT